LIRVWKATVTIKEDGVQALIIQALEGTWVAARHDNNHGIEGLI